MRDLPTWITLCGPTGLESSSAVSLDFGTGSRVDRARGPRSRSTPHRNHVSRLLLQASRRGENRNRRDWEDRSREERRAAEEDTGFLENLRCPGEQRARFHLTLLRPRRCIVCDHRAH